MNPSRSSTSFLRRLLEKVGGYYIVIVLALAQLIVSPLGILLAAVILTFNAGFSTPQVVKLAFFTGSVMVIRNLILLIGAHFFHITVIRRLSKWKHGETLSSGTVEESRSWNQITKLSWRYIAVAFSALMIFTMIPTLIYAQKVILANQDQIFYVLIAGIVAGISLALLEVLLIEQMLIPARIVLLPKSFQAQISGVLGFKLLGKFILVVIAIIIVSALLIAPIGYHQTVRVLYEEIGSLKVLADLQLQSVLVATFAILIGLGLSFLLARSISSPVRQLIDIFQRIEKGEKSQRVSVAATDEIGQLAVHFNHMADRLEDLQTDLEKRVAERTEQLRATIEVGQVASSILEPGELISRVVNLITERFGYYYSAVFLIDSTNQWAILNDATGEAGKTLKARGHRLELGEKSMVGSAITKHEARIALDVGIEPVRFNNPLLPDTRSEIALPLMIGDKVLGALDVQSTQEAAFDQENIITLQGMANQVAIALENARLFQETQRNLEELRAAHRLYVTDAWSSYATEKGEYEYSGAGSTEATDQGQSTIEVPIMLRDQTIGVLTLDGKEQWTSEERSLIEAVANQAALALENARLLEESQQVAQRERLVTEITAKIWGSPSIDFILQTAVKELSRALHADEAVIELKIE